MNLNLRSLVAMTLIMAALAALYHFREKVAAPTDEDIKRPQLTQFKVEDVTGLDCTVDDKPVKMEKQDGVWHVTAPYHGLASKKDVDAVLGPLADLKADRVVVEDGGTAANLKQYGLDKAKATFVVHLKDSKDAPTLLIGARAPSETGWYAMQPGNPRVVLAANSLAFAFVKQPADWRDKSPLSFEADQVDRVAVEGGSYALQLDKAKGTENWSLVKPKAAKAEGMEVNKLLESIKAVQAVRFVDDVKPDDPRLKPTLTLKVWGKDARDAQELRVGEATQGGRYAIRGTKVPEVFILPETALKVLQPDPLALLDHHLFDLAPEKVARAEMFQEEAGSASAEKKTASPGSTDGTWSFTKPADQRDEMGRVTALVYSLKGLKYEARVTDEARLKEATATFAKPFARFELLDEKGTRLAALEVGGQAGRQRRWVRVTGAPEVYIADASFAQDWKASIRALAPSPQPSGAPASSASPAASAAPGGR